MWNRLFSTTNFSRTILDSFPSGIAFAFAYGSGAFQQRGHADARRNVLDLVFAVENPIAWHAENIERNARHYSCLKRFGHETVAAVQERYGAGVYYNTLVSHRESGRLIKYGVISVGALLRDLTDWDTLYISGRLHKPVRVLVGGSDAIKRALDANLRSALRVAELCLPNEFTERDLFMQIAGLSFGGDFRMTFGEDRNKVANIVDGNFEGFRDLYAPFREDNFRRESRDEKLEKLPKNVRMQLSQHNGNIEASVAAIVKQSSLNQSLKGILTAGMWKSVIYSGSKLKKMFSSL
ncbi:phosphatidate cytidylyltransferase, mitochondrial-like [Oscarella lobularis]|uniref:phosphatidate cytidylyltransferase, mitochondrial-like n=1 Tax=Oscarella lobularis TaxID=121494 RepID=UPI003313C267